MIAFLEKMAVEEQKQLWEINEVILNNEYWRQPQPDSEVLYILKTKRTDLPVSFSSSDWEHALDAREEAERWAESSGRSAQEARRVFENPSNYQLQSQQIANHPNLGMLSLSAEAAKNLRRENKEKQWGFK